MSTDVCQYVDAGQQRLAAMSAAVVRCAELNDRAALKRLFDDGNDARMWQGAESRDRIALRGMSAALDAGAPDAFCVCCQQLRPRCVLLAPLIARADRSDNERFMLSLVVHGVVGGNTAEARRALGRAVMHGRLDNVRRLLANNVPSSTGFFQSALYYQETDVACELVAHPSFNLTENGAYAAKIAFRSGLYPVIRFTVLLLATRRDRQYIELLCTMLEHDARHIHARSDLAMHLRNLDNLRLDILGGEAPPTPRRASGGGVEGGRDGNAALCEEVVMPSEIPDVDAAVQVLQEEEEEEEDDELVPPEPALKQRRRSSRHAKVAKAFTLCTKCQLYVCKC